jgi:hypothetical protein
VVLVAQTDDLGCYPASAGPRPYRKRFLGVCECRIRALGDLGGLRLFQSGHFDAETVFDGLGVRGYQSVLGWDASFGPVGCLIARLQTAQFAQQTIP